MKLVTCIRSGASQPTIGVVRPDGEFLLDLRAAAIARGIDAAPFECMLTFLDGGERAVATVRQLVDSAAAQCGDEAMARLQDVRLLAPLPRPRSIRDCLAFEGHYIGAMRTVAKWKFGPLAGLDRGLARVLGRGFLRPPRVWYERPIYYKGNPASVVGHGADVHWPSFTQRLDYELELAVVIGREGKNIPVSRAREWIAGFTIFNDFTARDFQLYEMAGRLGPAKSKDFDTGNVLGPWLVTPDEVGDAYNLRMTARVNGEEWSRGNSSAMQFRFEEMISAISQDETLYPGDVIGSGTVPTGCGLELDRWIQPGDVVELEVERLGVLRSRVVREERG